VTLREMILSIPLHMQNIHEFPSNTNYKVPLLLYLLFVFLMSNMLVTHNPTSNEDKNLIRSTAVTWISPHPGVIRSG
jgi:hypothetical protein